MTISKHQLTIGRLGVVIAAAIAVLAAVPATSQAGPKFGAALKGATPEATPVKCPVAGAACTRAPIFYNDPSHAGMVPFAPKKGTIKRIRLKAAAPGAFRLQLVRIKGGPFPLVKGKVVGKAPRIRYKGTGGVEAFRVKLKVREGLWLAMRTRSTTAVQCENGVGSEAIFAPPLKLGAKLRLSNDTGDCTPLVQAVMK